MTLDASYIIIKMRNNNPENDIYRPNSDEDSDDETARNIKYEESNKSQKQKRRTANEIDALKKACIILDANKKSDSDELNQLLEHIPHLPQVPLSELRRICKSYRYRKKAIKKKDSSPSYDKAISISSSPVKSKASPIGSPASEVISLLVDKL